MVAFAIQDSADSDMFGNCSFTKIKIIKKIAENIDNSGLDVMKKWYLVGRQCASFLLIWTLASCHPPKQAFGALAVVHVALHPKCSRATIVWNLSVYFNFTGFYKNKIK